MSNENGEGARKRKDKVDKGDLLHTWADSFDFETINNFSILLPYINIFSL